MTLDRRTFLRRSALALGGLMVGDAALEAFERLTHHKVFALGGLPEFSAVRISTEVFTDVYLGEVRIALAGSPPSPVAAGDLVVLANPIGNGWYEADLPESLWRRS